MHELLRRTSPLLLSLLSVVPASAQSPAHTFEDLEDSFAALGDVDGDGVPDLVLGQLGFGTAVGRVEVRSGASGTSLFTLLGAAPDDGFARTLACVGDLDGDGRNDFAVSAPMAATPHVDVHSSADGGLLRTLPASVPGDFGMSLDSGGDVNGDGVFELLVGVIGSPSQPGQTLLVNLVNGETLRVHQSLGAGHSTAFLGDVDGDGRDDYALGTSSTSSLSFEGMVEVFSGATGALLYTALGSAPGSLFGGSLAACGDLDGDGVDELLVGAMNETGPGLHGALHVLSGATGVLLRHHVAFLPGPWNYFGASVCGVGDQNGDGVEDYASLAPKQITCDICQFPGKLFFFDGATGAPAEVWPGTGFFGPVGNAGDINLDGRPDVVFGSVGFTHYGATRVLLSGASLPQAYCTAKVTWAGCSPTITGIGAASLSVGSGVHVQADLLPPGVPGLLLWSKAPAAIPFAQGTLCIAPPASRKPAPTSLGASGCDGVAQATLGTADLAGSGFLAGDTLHLQVWARDQGFAPPNDVALTAGLHLPVLP